MAREGPRIRPGDASAFALLLTGAAFATWATAVTRMRVDPLAPSFTVFLHPLYLAALALLSMAFLVALRWGGAPRAVLLGQTVLLVAFQHLTPFLVEGVARFRTNWRNFGYAEYFARHETANPDLIWYHNWPSYFIGTHHVVEASGAGPNTVVGLIPFAMALAMLVGILTFFVMLFKGSTAPAFVATWIFVTANWIGIEQLGPQPMTFAVYLVLLALTLDQFRGDERIIKSHAAARGLMVLLCAALSVAHPLTAFFFIAGIAVTSVFRPSERRLVVLATLLFLVWITFGAYDYLLWKLGGYVSELGKLTLILNRGFGKSFDSSPEHQLVGVLRLAYTAAILGIGFLAAVATRAWKNPERRSVLVWAIVPFLFIGAFSYDGEILFRAFLFGFAPLAFFMAMAAREVPARLGRPQARRALHGAVAALVVATAVAHPAIRYGEEHLNFVHASEVRGMETFYDRALPDSRVLPMSCCILAETFLRDEVGTVWYGFVKWDEGRLNWTEADASVGRPSFSGPQYVWLGAADWQEYEFRENDPGAYERTRERLLAAGYPLVYDSGGLSVFYVSPGSGGGGP